MRKVLPIILVIAAAAAAGVYVGRALRTRKPAISGPALVVSFLDADRGGGVVVRTPEGKVLLIDPGPRSAAMALVDYLRGLDAGWVTAVITSTAADRAGGLEPLASSIRVSGVLHADAIARDGTWRRVSQELGRAGVPRLALTGGAAYSVSRSTRLEVLNASQPTRSASDHSLILRLSMGKRRLMLMSDADAAAEAELIESGADLTCDVLAVARGGRYGSTCLELVRCARPEFFVVQVSPRGAPSASVLNRISTHNTGAQVYRTDRDGAVDVVTDGRSIVASVEAARR